MSDRETWLRRFHDANPGITSRSLARTGSYGLLSSRVPKGARVLDVACGDGALLAQVGRGVGIDISREEIRAAQIRAASSRSTANLAELDGSREDAGATAAAPPQLVIGRAQDLPFADASFDVALCHLAFMLFDDLERVVAELARVLAPDGSFHAVLGGGPTAAGHDAFHEFLQRAPLTGPRFGDPRARSPEGWRALFAGWSEPVFERHELELSGPFDEVWAFLASSYQCAGVDLSAVRAAMRAELLACRVVVWVGSVRR